jgi:superfamily II DNA or RNA helicase
MPVTFTIINYLFTRTKNYIYVRVYVREGNMMIELRDYQKRAIELLRKELGRGNRRVILRLQTGAGKTATIGEVIKLAVAKGSHVIFLVHLRELVKQASAHLERIGVEHGIIMAGEDTDHSQSVFVASTQTYGRRIKLEDHWGDKIFLKKGDLVVIDECHHCGAETYKKILAQYPDAAIIGLSATPGRSDGQGLGEVFEAIVSPIDVKELIKLGFLVDADYYAPEKPDLEKIKIQAGDYNQKQLGAKMNKTVLVGNIYEHWRRLAAGKQTIIFAVNVAHSEHIRQTFQLQGVNCYHIDAHTPEEFRRQMIDAFKRKEITVLTNVGIFTEGFDAPGIECVVLARPTKSLNLYLQMAGRGLRPAEGKEKLTLIDHAGCIYEHGFLDEDHCWSLEGEAVTRGKAKKKDKEKSEKQHDCRQCQAIFKGTVCPMCGTGVAPDQMPYEAELVEVKTDKKVKMTSAEKQSFYSMALRYRQIKGYKPGYEAHTYRAKTGVWPRGVVEIPKEPDRNFLQFVRHLQIKKAHERSTNAI